MHLNYTVASECKIESIGIHEIDVYDLEVEDNHTFFANNICVHNTDSLYLNCNPLVEMFMPADAPRDKIVAFLDKFGKNVCQPIIDASVDYIFEHMNAHIKVMASKREAIASKMLFRARKNYAMYVHNSEGVSYNPPKLKVLGIEIVRSSTPKWCRKKLKELLNMMFEVEEEVFRAKFTQFEKEYMQLSPEEIASPRGVSDLTKYFNGVKFTPGVTIPMHVRAAALYNLHTKELKHLAPITNGDKIKFLPLKMPNKIKENVIGFPTNEKLPIEIGIHKYIDYDKQFFKTFETPMRSLTDVAGWKIREESSLEAFF